MNIESELARLVASASRLADLFDRVSDSLEAGQSAESAHRAVTTALKSVTAPERPAPEAPTQPTAAEPAPAAQAPEAPKLAAVPPWEAQAAEQAAQPEEKKPRRRTNEELAAEAGVDLDDVKRWLGEGKRVTKASIEEFAQMSKDAAMNNQTLHEAVEQPPAQEQPAPAADQSAPWPTENAQAAQAQPEQAPGFSEWPSSPFGGQGPF